MSTRQSAGVWPIDLDEARLLAELSGMDDRHPFPEPHPIAPGQVEIFTPDDLDPPPPQQAAIWPELIPSALVLVEQPSAKPSRIRSRLMRAVLAVALLVPSLGLLQLLPPAPMSIEAVAAAAGPSIVTIGVTDGVGSGVIIDQAGWIITNRHVVGVSKTVAVELASGERLEGAVYGIDSLTDLAIVRVDAGRALPALPLGDSDALRPGQEVVVIGTALGTYVNSVSAGIVSGLGRATEVENGVVLRSLIQTDAAINQGNSGGALLDRTGRLVGINSAVARLDVAQGIGFAIPVSAVKPLIEQARAGQALERPWLGIRFADLSAAEAQEVGVPGGALLDGDLLNPAVLPGSPADLAGLKSGDLIIAIAGRSIDQRHALDDLVSRHRPGETIEVAILRGTQRLVVMVTLGTRPRA